MCQRWWWWLPRQAGHWWSMGRKPRARVLPHCITRACGWCWISSYNTIPWCFLSPAPFSPYSQKHPPKAPWKALKWDMEAPVGSLNPTSHHPQQSSNASQNFIKLHLDDCPFLLKFEWKFCSISSMPSLISGSNFLQAAAKPLLCSAPKPLLWCLQKALTMSWLLEYWDCCLSCL